jgi:hypothetical protein
MLIENLNGHIKMKKNQGGVKISFVVFSVLALGISAWFTQANASELHDSNMQNVEYKINV